MPLAEILQVNCQPEADKHSKLSRILAFTDGVRNWKLLLADPDKPWKSGFSARTLAHCWEEAEDFPPEVVSAFSGNSYPLLKDIVPVLAVPEFKVPLPGSARGDSQNDILVLARSSAGAIIIMVEGKVNESFDKPLDKWLANASDGKKLRLHTSDT